MVASPPVDLQVPPSREQGGLRGRIVGEDRAPQWSLANVGGEVPSLARGEPDLNQRARELAAQATAVATSAKYAASWAGFVSFRLGKWKVTAENPPKLEEVMEYVAWMDIEMKGGGAKPFRAALADMCQRNGWSPVAENQFFRKVVKGAQRSHLSYKKGQEERDGFELIALRKHVAKLDSERSSDKIAWRDAAIVAVGFRTMRRAKEIANIRRGDVRTSTLPGQSPGMMVKIRKSKTDQLEVGKKIVVDPAPEGSAACPVRIVNRYISLFAGDLGPNDLLFTSVKGKELSSGAVSSIVKKMAERNGCVGRFTSHSLRIGGASAAVAGGMSLAEVAAIGGWVSGAMELYLRSMESARSGASSKMGF